MKYLLFVVMMVSTTVFARSTRDMALDWLKSQLPPSPLGGTKDFPGKTADGRQCGLLLTELSGTYSIVVGYKDATDPNDYIGVATSPSSDMKGNDRQINFHWDESWGNDSKTNSVRIDLGNGSVVSATGTSDLKSIKCEISAPQTNR